MIIKVDKDTFIDPNEVASLKTVYRRPRVSGVPPQWTEVVLKSGALRTVDTLTAQEVNKILWPHIGS